MDVFFYFGRVIVIYIQLDNGYIHLQVESLLLVVIHSSHLAGQRKEFETMMGSTVELVNEQTSCHQIIAESLVELKV